MTELALHILDIANNSTRAKATEVKISVVADSERDLLKISVSDNGCGMDKQLLERVTDPFATTRTTRKVGLGIPLFKQAAESTNGTFNIESEVGVGTTTTATFTLSHIDRVPMGDLTATMTTLVGGAPETDFVLYYEVNGKSYEFNTSPIREIMEGIPLSEPEVLSYIGEMIAENIENINGGIII
jgi:hypothetical protein